MSQQLVRAGEAFLFATLVILGPAGSARAQLRGSIGLVVPAPATVYVSPYRAFSYSVTAYSILESPVKTEYHRTPPSGAADTGLAGRRSYYEANVPGSAASGAMGRGAEIEVRLPAGADLWFEGVRTTQTGTYREFVSPPLAPGRDYAYELRASWREGGREVSRTRRVRVRAGDRLDVNFLTPAKEAEPVVIKKAVP